MNNGDQIIQLPSSNLIWSIFLFLPCEALISKDSAATIQSV